MNFVHLAIDYQERFLSYLPRKCRSLFAAAARAFANDLRRVGIPTIWVGYEDKVRCGEFLSTKDRSTPQNYFQEKVRTLGLQPVAPKIDEYIYSKDHDGAFDSTNLIDLASILQGKNFGSLLISGMNTRFCVSRSINGALTSGFNVIALHDLMADTTATEQENARPIWHKENMIYFVDDHYKQKVKPMTRAEYLRQHGLYPSTPVVQRNNWLSSMLSSFKRRIGLEAA